MGEDSTFDGLASGGSNAAPSLDSARPGGAPEFPDARYLDRFHPWAGPSDICAICGGPKNHRSHYDHLGFWGHTTLEGALTATGRWVFVPTRNPGRPKRSAVESAIPDEATAPPEAKTKSS